MKGRIASAVNDGIAALQQLQEPAGLAFIEEVARLCARCFADGGKLLIAGNGGSLCDAAHFAEELTGYFRHKRRALPALCLNDPGHLTCVGNDSSFDQVFARGVEAFGKEEDVFIGLTTSGNSPNIVRAVEKAKEVGMKTVAFLGKGGGLLKGMADVEFSVDGFVYSDRIQEAHMAAIHIIIEMMEGLMFEGEEVLHEALAHVRHMD